MRPGNQSNKRMRGRGRKGPNPLTRTYESNGPDVKIRGTAQHVAEKYQQLARDAQASGDRVMSENYFQHAEHYLRIVASAQAQNQPSDRPQRNDDDQDGQEVEATSSAPKSERRERGSKDRENRAPSVDPDSPQPFIENMPVIDDSGQLNGHAASGEASSDEKTEDDAKPRRRVRGTRGRGAKREGDAADGEAAAAAQPDAGEAAEAGAAPAKPKRRTTRRKPAEDKPAESEPVPAGE